MIKNTDTQSFKIDFNFLVLNIIFFIVLTLPLGITSIVVGSQIGACDIRDSMLNLNIQNYLLIHGIISLAFGIVNIALTTGIIYSGFKHLFTKISVCFSLLDILFRVYWTITGGIILFHSNIECIHANSPSVIYALILWCYIIIEAGVSVFAVKKIIGADITDKYIVQV